MQPVLLSRSDREDEEPRLILLAFVETDARNQISDIYRPDYRPLVADLQGGKMSILATAQCVPNRVGAGL